MLDADIAALRAEQAEDAAFRRGVVDRFRVALGEGRAAILAEFARRHGGLACASRLALLQDEIIQALYDYVVRYVYPLEKPSTSERLCVVAVGGYGRATLAPGSDIDLLFLLPYKQTPWGESVVEAMLYVLWDLRQKVGHSTRSVDECMRQAKADMTIRTALLESRFVLGDAALFDDLQVRFDKEVLAKTSREFVTAKMAERETRIARSGASRYLVEPNVKEGKGGLRDLNTLFWIAKYAYRVQDGAALVGAGLFTTKEFRLFCRCEEFLWRVRCELHIVSGRAEERLSFDYQRIIAERLGYGSGLNLSGVERFMKHYFLVAKNVGDLTAIVCAAIEEREAKQPATLDRIVSGLRRRSRSIPGTSDFAVEFDRITVAKSDVFERDPVNLIRLFSIADTYGLPIHPDATRLVTLSLRRIDRNLRANREANRLFMDLLTSRRAPETALAPDERGRGPGTLHPRIRPHRRADAVQHVPPLHGGRASPPRGRYPGRDRCRAAAATSIRWPMKSCTRSRDATRSISRCSCTTSRKGARRTTPWRAPIWRDNWRRASTCRTARPSS